MALQHFYESNMGSELFPVECLSKNEPKLYALRKVDVLLRLVSYWDVLRFFELSLPSDDFFAFFELLNSMNL